MRDKLRCPTNQFDCAQERFWAKAAQICSNAHRRLILGIFEASIEK
jgi:hypothetical protein